MVSFLHFHSMVIDEDSVQLHAPLHSWSLRREAIGRAYLVQKDDINAQPPEVCLWFVVEDRDGSEYESHSVSVERTDPLLPKYQEFFQHIESQLADP